MKLHFLLPFALVAACTEMADQRGDSAAGAAGEAQVAAPVTPVAAPPPPPAARTAEQFDTTSAQDRAEATAASSGGARLGTTIASLGSPTDPGIWMETPLVSAPVMGRVEYGGKSVTLELRPNGKAVGAGSQISLAAMRLLGVALTDLPEVTVYRN